MTNGNRFSTGEIWKAVKQKRAVSERFSEEADAWLQERKAITERIKVLTASAQCNDNVEAVVEYLSNEAHPSALYVLTMSQDLIEATRLPAMTALTFVRSIFACGYQQALRDAMDEEIVI